MAREMKIKEMTKYKGYFMLFGLFRIRKDFALFQECEGSPYAWNNKYIKRVEPWLQKWCTIKWIEFKEGDTELCYH